MTSDKFDNARRVYSTDVGRVAEEPTAAPAAPGDGTVRVGRSRAGRRGKTVTIVTGLPPADLAPVARELKRLCGSGGAVKDGAVELQGDHRERVVAHLAGRYRVKLAGGG
jgi:translation initiation factor 1